jgi:hypothetical protein
MTRVYRVSVSTRWGAYLAGSAIAAGCAYLAWRNSGTSTGAMGSSALFLLLGIPVGVYLIAWAWAAEIVLTDESITLIRPLLSKRTLRRDEIFGVRVIRFARGGPMAPYKTSLIPSTAGLRTIEISHEFESDAALAAWLNVFPDLSTAEARALEATISSNPALGPTSESRQETVARTRRIAITASLVVSAAIVMIVSIPSAPGILLAAVGAIPWTTLWFVRRSPERYRLNTRTDAAHADLSVLVIAPGAALALAALVGARMVHWEQLVPPAAAISIALFATVLWAEPTRRTLSGRNVVLLALLFMYGGGAAALLDARLDRSAPQVFRADRIASHVSYGRGRTTRFLTLMPWGPQKEVRDVSVSSAVFAAAGRGEPVCVNLYSGALGIAWYVVVLCN